jgi:oxygen-independent coproporphyrinogen-3 oxidase
MAAAQNPVKDPADRTAEEAPAGLYVHVPYCASLCGYCDFYRIAASAGVPEGFEDRILQEAGLYAQVPEVAADTVYFGGGTPSLLSGARLARILRGLRGVFAVAEGAETTLEANPETVDRRSLEGWREAGVNRLSIGVQSFHPRVLSLLDRRATADRAMEAVREASRAGYRRLSVDLMAGVPGQSVRDLEEDLRKASDLPVDHLSLYALDLHPGTPLGAGVERGEVRLPSEDLSARMLERAHEILAEAGWEHYEISNFARAGGECRHNLKYWLGGEYVGLGPSAWSRFRGRLRGNPRDAAAWAQALDAGAPPWRSEEILDARRRLEDRLLFGLRLAEGVPLIEVERLFEGARAPLSSLLDRFRKEEWAETQGGRLRLTPRGFLVSTALLAELLHALPSPVKRDSSGEGSGDP